MSNCKHEANLGVARYCKRAVAYCTPEQFLTCRVKERTGTPFNRMVHTNYERITSMTMEEMAKDLLPMIEEVIADGVPCEELMLMWLRSEAEEV